MSFKASSFFIIKKIIFRLNFVRETGILSKHRDQWMAPKKPDCQSGAITVSVGLDYTSFLFILLAFGMVLSLFLLVLEKIYFIRTQNNCI